MVALGAYAPEGRGIYKAKGIGCGAWGRALFYFCGRGAVKAFLKKHIEHRMLGGKREKKDLGYSKFIFINNPLRHDQQA